MKKYGTLIAKTLLTFAVVCAVAVLGKMPVEAAPAKVTGVKQIGASDDTAYFEWKAVSGDYDRYNIYCSTTKDGNYVLVDDSLSTSWWIDDISVSGMKAGSSYWVKVAVVVDDVVGAKSDAVEMVTSPAVKPVLKHTASSETAIALDWSSVKGANCYALQYARTDSDKPALKYTSKTEYCIKNLTKNREYNVAVTPARKSSSGYIAHSNDTAYAAYLPVKPTKATKLVVAQSQGSSQISARCQARASADGYQWQVYDMSGSKAKLVTTTTSGYESKYISKSALKNKRFYAVRVRAYSGTSDAKKFSFGNWSDWAYVCQQPKIQGKVYSSGIKMSWDKIGGADRYVVYLSTKSTSGYKKYTTTTKNNTSIPASKLKSGKTYYFYVVAQKKVGDKYVSGNTSERIYYGTY